MVRAGADGSALPHLGSRVTGDSSLCKVYIEVSLCAYTYFISGISSLASFILVMHLMDCDDDCQVLKIAREKFTQEISFQSKDKDISLAKVIFFTIPLFLYAHPVKKRLNLG